MNKNLFVLLSFLFMLLTSLRCVNASIVTIGRTGAVSVNVLSAEDVDENNETSQSESVRVSDSSVEMGEADMPISLFRKDGKYLLNIAGKNGELSFDVSDYQTERILEIEERPSVKKIGISLSDNRFVIEQPGVKAKTDYQINIEPQKSRITILTPTGYKFLTMLPRDAVDMLLRSKSITNLTPERTIEIAEDPNGNLYYQVSGVKRVGIKDIYMYDAPVSARISVTSGEIMEIDEPIWLKVLGLFTVST